MVIERTVSGFSSTISRGSIPLQSQYLNHDAHGMSRELVYGATIAAESSGTQLMRSLLFSLSILKEKVQEVESFVNYHRFQLLDELALSSVTHLVQGVVEASSCMMLNCQEMAVGSSSTTLLVDGCSQHPQQFHEHLQQVLVSENAHDGGLEAPRVSEHVEGIPNNGNDYYQQSFNNNDDNIFSDWYIHHGNCATNYFIASDASKTTITGSASTTTTSLPEGITDLRTTMNQEREVSVVVEGKVVELDATDLLATYTHYCQVCGRGFKREANLKMHLRAHGDHYMNNLPHPKNKNHEKVNIAAIDPATRYSCPHEGCRWNKKHPKFQPLKSFVCVRNHYKRSHCPKMFMCKRCNTRKFSVLSDLKSHEKQCGDATQWYCSCGTGFSKKDKLLNHVLFAGHTPLIMNPLFGHQVSDKSTT